MCGGFPLTVTAFMVMICVVDNVSHTGYEINLSHCVPFFLFLWVVGLFEECNVLLMIRVFHFLCVNIVAIECLSHGGGFHRYCS